MKTYLSKKRGPKVKYPGESSADRMKRLNKAGISVELGCEQLERLREIAKKNERAVGGEIRLMIRRFLDENKSED
jgi:hypothetical protein